MFSWMSANYIRCSIILLIFYIGCVPPAYRHQENTHKKNSTQKPYQFNYNDDESIPLIQNEDNYYIKNEYYTTQPVYYSTPLVQNDIDNQNSELNEKKYNKKLQPKGTWHSIRKGETLYSLSRQYNTTVDAICSANNMKDSTTIKIGQKIFIPSGTTDNSIATKKAYPAQTHTKNLIKDIYFMWPVPSVISYSRDQGGVRPLGIIITSRPKSKVVASAQGKVAKIGTMRGFGNFVVIMHPENVYTIYSMLDAISVKEGQLVPQGTIIGFLSDSNPSLHFQINHSGTPQDPLRYLAQK